jgi:hypothetical protein
MICLPNLGKVIASTILITQMMKLIFRLGILITLTAFAAFVMSLVVSSNNEAGLYAPEDSPIFTDFTWFFIVMMLPVLLQIPIIVFAATRFRSWAVSRPQAQFSILMTVLAFSWVSATSIQMLWTLGSMDSNHWKISIAMSLMLLTTSIFIIRDLRWIWKERRRLTVA